MHLNVIFCKYKCKNKKILTNHKTKNLGDQKKSFICETRFSTAETLKIHEDMHTDYETFDSLKRLCDSVTNQLHVNVVLLAAGAAVFSSLHRVKAAGLYDI